MANLTVHVDQSYSEKLNTSSANRRFYPYDKPVIDWSVPIDDRHRYVPDGFSILDGAPISARLSAQEISYVTRWETTRFLRNNHIGEHLLNQALLVILHKTDPYDPAWRYMLHEVAEECQHMMMFNQWIRLNDDIRTRGVGADRWGTVASVAASILSPRLPETVWSLILAFELFGDEWAQAAARDRSSNLHPIIRQIGRTHMVEEARHMAFAEEWLQHHIPGLSRARRVLLNESIERVLAVSIRMGMALYGYDRQLQPYLSYDEFKQCIKSAERRNLANSIWMPLVDSYVELGVVRRGTAKKWLRKGLLRPVA